MADGRLDKLKQALQSVFLTHIPDHPAHGGNTGESEWPPEKNENGSESEQEASDEQSN